MRSTTLKILENVVIGLKFCRRKQPVQHVVRKRQDFGLEEGQLLARLNRDSDCPLVACRGLGVRGVLIAAQAGIDREAGDLQLQIEDGAKGLGCGSRILAQFAAITHGRFEPGRNRVEL